MTPSSSLFGDLLGEIAPGEVDPSSAIRDRLLYRSAAESSKAKSAGFQGDDMNVDKNDFQLPIEAPAAKPKQKEQERNEKKEPDSPTGEDRKLPGLAEVMGIGKLRDKALSREADREADRDAMSLAEIDRRKPHEDLMAAGMAAGMDVSREESEKDEPPEPEDEELSERIERELMELV